MVSIIQLSTSMLSSEILRMKKKDGSWKFCVDYCALNKETIPDEFPILLIDELLDELNGSTMFLNSTSSRVIIKSG